jgi:hypothetical protein
MGSKISSKTTKNNGRWSVYFCLLSKGKIGTLDESPITSFNNYGEKIPLALQLILNDPIYSNESLDVKTIFKNIK